MTKRNTALAEAGGTELVIPGDLEAAFDAATPDIDPDARRVPTIHWNLSGGEDAHGDPFRKDRLYVTDEDEPLEALHLVPLEIVRKGARWGESQDGQDYVIFCTSDDRHHGVRTLESPEYAGDRINCADCGRLAWMGKTKPACAANETVVFWDTQAKRVIVCRFQSTGKVAWHDFLRKRVLGKRTLGDGSRADWPLPAFHVRMSVVQASRVREGDRRDYTVPVFEAIDDKWFNDVDTVRRMLKVREQMIREFRTGAAEVVEESSPPGLDANGPAGTHEMAEVENGANDDGGELPF